MYTLHLRRVGLQAVQQAMKLLQFSRVGAVPGSITTRTASAAGSEVHLQSVCPCLVVLASKGWLFCSAAV